MYDYTFPFRVFNSSEVAIYTKPSGGTVSLLDSTLYSVELNSDQDSAPGGTVTLTSPLALNATMVIVSAIPYTQELGLEDQGAFNASDLNGAWDKNCLLIQQLLDMLNRAVLVPELWDRPKEADELIGYLVERTAGVEEAAEAAAESEANAKESETNAAESEANAKTSETNAKLSETNAKTSETNVATNTAHVDEVAEWITTDYPDAVSALANLAEYETERENIWLMLIAKESLAQQAFTRAEIVSYEHWLDAGLSLLARASDVSVNHVADTQSFISDVYRWYDDGLDVVRRLVDTSDRHLHENEQLIVACDDDRRMQKLLVRTYVESPYVLFIVAGQSNAVGSGGGKGIMDASYCGLYWNWSNQSSKSLKPLKDPVYRSTTKSAWPAFAQKFFELTGRKVIILNVAWGGAAVVNTGTENTWYGDDSVRRSNATTEWTDMTAALEAGGYDYELAGMMWVQGEAETTRVQAGTVTADEYKECTLDVFDFFRTLTGKTDLPVYIGKIGYNDVALENADRKAAYDTIREAQDELGRENENVYVACDLPATYIYAGYMYDSIHYNMRGYNSMGHSLARFITNNQTF